MPTSNISFRSHLLGSVSDFCESCGLGSLAKASVVVDLVVALARYAEEGRRLYPDVYLVRSLHQALRLLPGSDVLAIGEADLDAAFVKQALKKCAPLAVGGWKIYFELHADRVRFGVFHGDLNPLAVSMEDTLFGFDGAGPPVVRIHQIADDCVEIRHAGDHRHNIYLSNRRESEPAPNRHLAALAGAICRDVAPESREPVTAYVTRTLQGALRASHGSLVAVATHPRLPTFLKDGVALVPPLDLVAKVAEARSEPRDQSSLFATSSLAVGMFGSDGIVVFSKTAVALAFNCFVKPPRAAGRVPAGGARRRAFEALRSRLGRGLSAVYIQSQDGSTEFEERT